EEKAQTLLALGSTEAQAIRDKAETERRDLVNAAEVDAEKEKARALELSKEAFKVFEAQPDLAIYLRKVEAVKRALTGNKVTVVLDTSTSPFDILKNVAPVGSSTK